MTNEQFKVPLSKRRPLLQIVKTALKLALNG